MLVPILILSSVFILVAFSVNETNAKYLLSGYNTMSEEERKNFDIKSYIPFFRKFHIFLGISLFVISMLLNYFISSVVSGVFMTSYPILAYLYFIWKGNRFVKELSKKQHRVTYIAMGFLLVILLVIVYAFKSSLSDNEIRVDSQQIEITGDYGANIKISDLKSIELLDKLPEISFKSNGFALGNIKKGLFKTADDENVTLLLNSNQSPIILLTTYANQKIYYSSKEKSNEDIYRDLRLKINMK